LGSTNTTESEPGHPPGPKKEKNQKGKKHGPEREQPTFQAQSTEIQRNPGRGPLLGRPSGTAQSTKKLRQKTVSEKSKQTKMVAVSCR
jgi:hypothetical protein